MARGDGSKPGSRPAPRRSRTRRQRALLILGPACAVMLLLSAAVVLYANAKWTRIARKDVALDEAGFDQPQNYLVVGSDSRDAVDRGAPDASAFVGGAGDAPSGQRSDTIMVVRVDATSTRLQILSLPRDLWVPIAGTGQNDRLNSAYAQSAQRLVDTVKQDFGIEIHHYIEIDFRGFKDVVTALGGVPVYFDKKLRDTNSGLVIDRAGCVTLGGDQALAFARARHLQYYDDAKGRWFDDPTGDLGRMSRQQVFMRRVFDRAKAKVSSTDLAGTNAFIDASTASLKLDRHLDASAALSLARRFSGVSGDDILTYSLPLIPYTTAGGGAVVRLNLTDAQPVLNIFRGLPPDALPVSQTRFSIMHAGGQAAAAAAARDRFANIGFTVGVEGGASAGAHSAVRFSPGGARIAQEIARWVEPGASLVEDPGMHDGRIVLVLGGDWKGVADVAKPLEAVPLAPAPGSGASPGSTALPAGSVAADDQVGFVPKAPPAGIPCA